MPEKDYWNIDDNILQSSHIITGLEDLANFSFEVLRLKDVYSYEEMY